ncbi:MAG TPA: type 4a pilus biogenesis protein PilO [Vicinamibacterales bacterium]|nr:type 4a pilus biogenesis protein PilO [Vicinamibacterales bacterium]
MELSLSKLPWYGQLAAFVVVCAGAVFGFWNFYVSDVQADITLRQTHLRALRADVNKGVVTARRLPEFEGQVKDLEKRLDGLRQVLPEQKDVADTLRRLQGLATQSNLSILRFTPAATKQEAMYLEVPYHLVAEGTYHDLGVFFDRISKFPRIIDVSNISIKALPQQKPSATVVAECTATTFVLQQETGKGGRGGRRPRGR